MDNLDIAQIGSAGDQRLQQRRRHPTAAADIDAIAGLNEGHRLVRRYHPRRRR
jgi:hypothetical protein